MNQRLNLNDLIEMFPKIPGTRAMTGYIPMKYFKANEKEIRSAMRDSTLIYRVVYRGPRNNTGSNWTLRKDAIAAVIYFSPYRWF